MSKKIISAGISLIWFEVSLMSPGSNLISRLLEYGDKSVSNSFSENGEFATIFLSKS